MCVLLGSHLTDLVAAPMRSRFLRTARQHLAAGGRLVLQRHDPAAFATAPVDRERGDLRFTVDGVPRTGPETVAATLISTVGLKQRVQNVTLHDLDDQQLEAELRAAGLPRERYLTDDRTWALARRPA